jgi:hypothetical protein
MFILFALPGLFLHLEFSRFRGCSPSKSKRKGHVEVKTVPNI